MVRYGPSRTDTRFSPDHFGEEHLLHAYNEVFHLFREGSYAASDRVGQQAPQFDLPWGGRRFTSDHLKGQEALLLFLDSKGEFCTPVRQTVEAISQQENLTPVLLYADREPEATPNPAGAIVLKHAAKTATTYGVTGYPTLFLLDPDGRIRWVKVGYTPSLAEELELAIRQMRRPSQQPPH